MRLVCGVDLLVHPTGVCTRLSYVDRLEVGGTDALGG